MGLSWKELFRKQAWSWFEPDVTDKPDRLVQDFLFSDFAKGFSILLALKPSSTHVFFAETGPATEHSCDIILHALVKIVPTTNWFGKNDSWHWDFNPRPSKHESSAITIKQRCFPSMKNVYWFLGGWVGDWGVGGLKDYTGPMHVKIWTVVKDLNF